MRISLIVQGYSTQGKGIGGGAGPGVLVRSGIVQALRAQGHAVSGPHEVQLRVEEEQAYGDWKRVAVANLHLAGLVSAARRRGEFVLGLFADCNSLLGALAGLARSPEPAWPHRVGLVWVDAHADYNTPETSPSGMLGGMPVAVACGKCLISLRKTSGLRVPLQQSDLIMVGLRDVDPGERAALEHDGVVTLTLEDLLGGSERLHWAVDNLSAREDLLYVHVDLDILDPELAPAAGLPVPGGISGRQLGDGLRRLLSYPKVAALALVSYKADRDTTGETRSQVTDALLGATVGTGEA